jgi:L-fuconolactonase
METEWLLASARANTAIAGVVGWVPIEADDLTTTLDRFAGDGKLVGFREIVQSEPDGFLDRPDFNRGIGTLSDRGFVYDLLIREHQLPEATRFVDRHPNQRFVLDHAAKPRIAMGELHPWAERLRNLARRANVVCKISGLATEADWSSWSDVSLRPFLDVCVDAFGPDRLLAGSDWPVCLLASSYSRWWDMLRAYFSVFTQHEQHQIFGKNAVATYHLRLEPTL